MVFRHFFYISFFFITSISASERLRERFRTNGVVPLSQLRRVQITLKEVELGKLLFFDKILSGNKNIACSTCHHPDLFSGDELALPFGEGGVGLGEQRVQWNSHIVPRNAPPVFNRGFADFEIMMWDGRIAITAAKGVQSPEPLLNGFNPRLQKLLKPVKNTLALQAFFPVTSNDEMKGHGHENELSSARSNPEIWEKIGQRIQNIDEYVELFKSTYSDIKTKEDIHMGYIANAIAAYETFAFDASRTKFDLFLEGKEDLSPSQKRGAELFLSKGRCISCHNGPFLTDSKFHNLGVPQIGPGKQTKDDKGLFLITLKERDLYKFKTPPLRNVAVTGPWMHDGFFTNLKGVLKHHVNFQESFQLCLEKPELQVKSKQLLESLDLSRENNQLRVSLLDEIILETETFNEKEIDDLYQFLLTLTDLSFVDRDIAPTSVPSKLPLD